MPRGELPTAHELKILTMSWGKEKRTLKSLQIQTLNYSEILALKKNDCADKDNMGITLHLDIKTDQLTCCVHSTNVPYHTCANNTQHNQYHFIA
jgi:hypothetical protein